MAEADAIRLVGEGAAPAEGDVGSSEGAGEAGAAEGAGEIAEGVELVTLQNVHGVTNLG